MWSLYSLSIDEIKEYDKDQFSVEAYNLLNFIKFRRSVRKFKNMKVEKEKISKIIDSGRFIQTATNSQDVSYIVVTEKLNELRNLAYKSLKVKDEYILTNLTPETRYLCQKWGHWKTKVLSIPFKLTTLF